MNTIQAKIDQAIENKNKRIDTAIEKREKSIAYFNSINSAISLLGEKAKFGGKSEDETVKKFLIEWRDWFYKQWQEWYLDNIIPKSVKIDWEVEDEKWQKSYNENSQLADINLEINKDNKNEL